MLPPKKDVVICMIEDDPGHARLIEKNIRRGGVNNEILHFRDGTSALAYFFSTDRSSVPLFILLDLNLPDMSGVQLLEQLKADKALHRVPVVVLSSIDDKQEVDRCYELGANAYVTKPVDFDAFSRSVTQLGLFFSIVQIPPLD